MTWKKSFSILAVLLLILGIFTFFTSNNVLANSGDRDDTVYSKDLFVVKEKVTFNKENLKYKNVLILSTGTLELIDSTFFCNQLTVKENGKMIMDGSNLDLNGDLFIDGSFSMKKS